MKKWNHEERDFTPSKFALLMIYINKLMVNECNVEVLEELEGEIKENL